MLPLASRLTRFSSLARGSSVLAPTWEQHRFYRSADTAVDDSHPKGFLPIYVHHVSKIVLEHLQDSRSEWLVGNGLDRGLHINQNGTFVLNFPARKGFDAGRIWTSYDGGKKQHWLSVYRQKLTGRFLLKDHGKCMKTTKVHDAARSEQQIQAAVDQMIMSINQAESSKIKL